jgi:signal transduction histidine kinase
MATCDWDFTSKKMIWFGNHHQLFGAVPPETRASFEALQNLVDPSDRGAFVEAIDQAAKEGGLFDVEFRIHWPDKSIHWLQLQGQLFLRPGGEPQRAIGVIIEVTQQKELEATLRNNQNLLESRVNERTAELADAISALRRENIQRQIAQGARDSLVRQLSAAQEDERRRISRELHDETGQHLTALLLGLKTLEPFLKAPDAARQLKELQALTGQLGEEIHRIAVQLRPTSLDDLGLHKTLTNFVHEWSSRSKVAVELHIEGLDQSRLPSEIETILYRIVQESLTNVARHAGAQNVSLVLQRHPRHVTLIIEDDGKGFDVQSALGAASDRSDGRAHLGLLGMKERVVLVGGELEIESIPSEGTTLFVRIPLVAAAERSQLNSGSGAVAPPRNSIQLPSRPESGRDLNGPA